MVLRSDSPLVAAGALVLLVHAARAAAPTESAAPPSRVRRLTGEASGLVRSWFSPASSISSGMTVDLPKNLWCGLRRALDETESPLARGVQPQAARGAPLDEAREGTDDQREGDVDPHRGGVELERPEAQ